MQAATESMDSQADEYMLHLNPPQREAVESTQGAVLVLAGAGTGKTSVLTTRIAHLLKTKQAFAGQILAVTFTNKAAKEMVSRVQKLLFTPTNEPEFDEHGYPLHAASPTDTTRGMWLGTFHSIAARILRRHAESVGLTSSFTILDSDDQLRLLKTLMKETNIDDKMYPPKHVLATIQTWKDKGLAPNKVTSSHLGDNPSAAVAQRIYETYQARLKQVNACDFGDLLLHNLTIFSEQPTVLQEYSNRFRYIMVDEYQDTNVGQYLWLRLLAMTHENICCVGDDDQSIYGWRGAEVGNILRFEKDYAGAKVIRLEQNYRSTDHILGAASSLITHNQGRYSKTLWTDISGGEKIIIKPTWDDGEEARFVGEEVESQQRDNISLNDMAILVRAGFQTRAFEERFLILGINYKVVGGLRFYERMEIRDAIAYLRLAVQPRDDLAFERIINTPKRGIGKATLEKLHIHGREQNCSMIESGKSLLSNGVIKGKAKTTLAEFFNLLDKWKLQSETMPPAELAEQMLETSGYIAMWKADKTPEASGRLENIRELYRALAEFPTVLEFLEHVGLVMDKDANTDDNSEMLSIMTLHAAKGLEFNTVFLTGWEEGLFPHQRAIDESGNKGLEEERRLAYVGITRAKKTLYISHAANRRIFGQWQSSVPSRFLAELPKDNIEQLEGGAYGTSQANTPQLFQSKMDNIIASAERIEPHNKPKNNYNISNYNPSKYQPKNVSTDKSSYSNKNDTFAGKKVTHVKFGAGKVISSNGGNLDIMFEKVGRKKIMKDFVKFA